MLSTDFLTWFFMLYCLFYNLLLTAFAIVFRRSKPLAPVNTQPLSRPLDRELPIITVMIPALNEGQVLRKTVQALLAQPYRGQLEILLIDDASQDDTRRIGYQLCQSYEHVYLLARDLPQAHQGKAEALNAGVDFLQKRFPERDPQRWVIGVFDADGRPIETDLIQRVGESFVDARVSALQCGVRIANRRRWLPRMQDLEFSAFCYIAQWVRDRTTGSVALGGNGQFARASTLIALAQKHGHVWAPESLTEDLELSIRIHAQGGVIRFLNRFVEQEGVESLRALLRQRHRWAWGTLQVFVTYVVSGRLLRARLPLMKKLDLHYYLSFWIVPVLVLFTLGLFVLAQLRLLGVTNHFPLALLIANSFSFFPLVVLGLVEVKTPWYRIPLSVFMVTFYTYHWVPLLIIAWVDIIFRRKPRWAKTARVHS
jgi:cellulose synthase/poly-beta-1,6-N-acetylglucosamine synthase-like glycosyltransferase